MNAIAWPLRLFMQEMRMAFALALLNAGRSIPDKIAMMAMTTSNSIKVNADRGPSDFLVSSIDGKKSFLSFIYFELLNALMGSNSCLTVD